VAARLATQSTTTRRHMTGYLTDVVAHTRP